jgi:hypothetical protein
MKSLIVKPSALARTTAKQTSVAAAAGLALINKALNDEVVQAIVDADQFRAEMRTPEYLGEEGDERAAWLRPAKPLHRRCLRNAPRALEVAHVLGDLIWFRPRWQITQSEASQMLTYLFAAMGKRRGDDTTAKLLACADIFSPSSNALGAALDLWAPTPRHPAILALAIRQLMAAKVHEPAESELREALATVKQTIANQHHWVTQWLDVLERADRIVFRFDRPAWDAAYQAVDSRVAQAMLPTMEEPTLDDDGNRVAGSPRWQALQSLWQRKLEAEEAAKLAAAPEPQRLAACSAKPPKRTRAMKE